ncbi:MAG: MFS transporter [Hyphomicrobiales bacterium]|nr:MFS transporter [Hyphomicrobiales bacterium]
MSPPSPKLFSRTSPVTFLMTLAFTNWIGFACWQALVNNFGKEAAGFTGLDIGMMQSVREIPGFMAFTAIVLFLFLREQLLAYLSLFLLGFGIALTGYYPSLTGILITTFVMSVGFHYFETAQQALSLQIIPKDEAARTLGKVASAVAAAQLLSFGVIALSWKLFQPSWQTLFLCAGGATILLAAGAWAFFPRVQGSTPQNKGLVLRKRYGLYYALTFMSGARRQIFMAFGGFLLVERFGYDLSAIAVLMLATYATNVVVAPTIGGLIGKLGERLTIQIENISLICVFFGYALASQGVFGDWGAFVVGKLFVLDGMFVTLIIAQKTYFQKIADPADIAPTAAVAFSINHIAAVGLPVSFGVLWTTIDPSVVFYIGMAIASVSLTLAFLVPRHPRPGHETTLLRKADIAPAE